MRSNKINQVAFLVLTFMIIGWLSNPANLKAIFTWLLFFSLFMEVVLIIGIACMFISILCIMRRNKSRV